jgi:hypothetical protein
MKLPIKKIKKMFEATYFNTVLTLYISDRLLFFGVFIVLLILPDCRKCPSWLRYKGSRAAKSFTQSSPLLPKLQWLIDTPLSSKPVQKGHRLTLVAACMVLRAHNTWAFTIAGFWYCEKMLQREWFYVVTNTHTSVGCLQTVLHWERAKMHCTLLFHPVG